MPMEMIKMIRRSAERNIKKFEKRFDGDGFITVQNLINEDGEINGKGRNFAHTVLNPGCGIGYHVHNGDMEAYYVLKGTGEYNDNGTVTTVNPGDTTFTYSGEGHSLKNTGSEPLEIITLILYN